MLFNSFQFAIFFICVYLLNRLLTHKWQNRFLLVASYIFYGSWDWRFLSLIVYSTVLDYLCGLKIHESHTPFQRKFFLTLSLLGNLSVLMFFKYYNFFIGSIDNLILPLGISLDPLYLNIILPIGISFYTFQTLSYTIDIYYKKISPTRCFWDFALFVAFFPQLVAGPIERAKRLLPQIQKPRVFDLNQYYEGCYLIFWGLFLKIFVADNLATIVDPVFSSDAAISGKDVLIAMYAFAFQIFGDFAGYSNIAVGLGKLLGFNIMLNFNCPYFSTNPREFWRRWHISLSSWLKDYLYIPLGGNKGGRIRVFRCLMITMILGGLWHGAAWTFVLWGVYHAALLIVHRLFEPVLEKLSGIPNQWWQKCWLILRIIIFFHLICFGWLIFRAQSLTQLGEMLHVLMFHFRSTEEFAVYSNFRILGFFVCIPILIQMIQYTKNDLFFILRSSTIFKTIIYVVLFYLMLNYGVSGAKEFIYFQF